MTYLSLLIKHWRESIIGLLLIVIVAVGALYYERGNNIDRINAKHKIQQITEQAKYQAQARQIERANNQRWQNAVNENTQAQQKMADSYTANSVIVDSLSDTIDKSTAAYTKTAAAADAKYAVALADVSKQCIAEITAMARVSDGHVADIRMMQDAWPER